MKFVYVDESISSAKRPNGIFVMVGLMVDAYKLRKVTSEANKFLDKLCKYYDLPELKTSSFLGKNKRISSVCLEGRKQHVREICKMISKNTNIYGIALSYKNLDEFVEKYKKSSLSEDRLKKIKNEWYMSAIFISNLIQKKVLNISNKGLTVLIFDNNAIETPKISEFLNSPDHWFYLSGATNKVKSEKNQTKEFDKIINTAFSIKSEHSSLIQFADAVCYVYRRWLELKKCDEVYAREEKKYYQELVDVLEKKCRVRIGRLPKSDCADFYEKAKHTDWLL